MIRPADKADCEALARIYNHYILHTTVTFEEEAVTADTMAARLDETVAASLPWLVLEEAERVVGYAYAAKWKGRCAYRYSVESTVYLEPTATGRGFGMALYDVLLPLLRERRAHVIIAGIALPNAASVALHEKLGMEKVAHFREVGFKFEQWIDVGYWQRTL